MPPYLYISTWGADDALVIVDACPTCNPSLVGVCQDATFVAPSGVSVYGGFAYLVDQTADQLSIIDVSDPTNPILVSAIAGAGAPNFLNGAYHCHVRNNGLCYVVSIVDDALSIFDISAPAAGPVLVGSIQGVGAPNFLGNPSSVYVDDSLQAYVAAALNNSLTIIDVSNPAAPVFRGRINGVGAPNFLASVRKVVVRGIYAYTVSFTDGALSIFNISNPAAPTLVGTVAHACLAGGWDISILGNYAYTAGETANALGVFNIANPAAPAFVGQLVDVAHFQSPRGIIAPASAFPRVYILGSNAVPDSCNRVDVSNPAAPVFQNWLRGSGPPNYMTTPQFIALSQTFPPVAQTVPATEVT